MTALAEKLNEAGADTLGAQLTTACIEGLRISPNNARAAWEHAFNAVGRELLIRLMADMAPKPSLSEQLIRKAQSRPLPSRPAELITPSMPAAKPYTPRVIEPARIERRVRLQELVRSKYKNSSGVSWSDVGWHELPLLTRDGVEARALLAACSASVPNDGRTVGEVLGVKLVDDIVAKVRKDSQFRE